MCMFTKFLRYFFIMSLFIVAGCGGVPQGREKTLPYGDDGINTPETNTTTQTDTYTTSTITTPTSTMSTSTVNSSNTSTMETTAKHYVVTLHTSQGNIEITLNTDQTPKTVQNFVNLSRKGFYNGTIFHRVIKGFMIQGGDPKGDGTGGPGYQFDDEKFTGEYTRGTVAMANAGPNTNGSQFFIMHADYPLPKNYVIFGHVTKGIDVVDKIANSEVTVSNGGEPSKPVNPTKVQTVDVKEE